MVDKPNIVFIVLDTARAKTLADEFEIMPNVCNLASEGTRFVNAFSAAPWTVPSHASMFTGKYPSNHGTHAKSKTLNPNVPTIAESFSESGYQTVGFSNNTWITSEFSFDRGFDSFLDTTQIIDGGANLVSIAKNKDRTVDQIKAVGSQIFDRQGHKTISNAVYAKFIRGRYDSGALITNWSIKRWLSNQRKRNKPFFMFINYLEPHLKYDPPEDFKYMFMNSSISQSDLEEINQDPWRFVCNEADMDESDFQILHSLYKAELAYLDYRIGKLYEFFDQKNLLNETVFVIAGDHGENIGDHGLMDHQYCLYDTLIHVPLIIQGGIFDGGDIVSDLVQLPDLAPTLLDIADIDDPDFRDDIQGYSFHPDTGAPDRPYVFSEYMGPQPSMNSLKKYTTDLPPDVRKFDRSLRSIRGKKWKFIRSSDGEKELYDLDIDNEEADNIADSHPEKVEKLESNLDQWLDSFEHLERDETTQMTEDTKGRLEDLGYL